MQMGMTMMLREEAGLLLSAGEEREESARGPAHQDGSIPHLAAIESGKRAGEFVVLPRGIVREVWGRGKRGTI